MSRYLKLFFIVALLCLISFGAILIFQDRNTTNKLVKRANYFELSNKKPTFYLKIGTQNSTTHVFSYLDAHILPEKNFNTTVTRDVISYIESFSKEKNMFKHNPFIEGGSEIEIMLDIRKPSRDDDIENFVFIISDYKKIPKFLHDQREMFPLLNKSISENKSFAWTTFSDLGNVTVIYFLDDDSFKGGLPTVNSKDLDTMQRLNFIFNVEVWKRTAMILPTRNNKYIQGQDDVFYEHSESLWNSFGQLVAAKQEHIPSTLLKERFESNPLSEELNVRYYPFDETAQRLYENAPAEPIIR